MNEIETEKVFLLAVATTIVVGILSAMISGMITDKNILECVKVKSAVACKCLYGNRGSDTAVLCNSIKGE